MRKTARPQWVESIERLASAVAPRHGAEFVAVEIAGDGRRPIVRVSVDSPGGVSVDQCAHISEELGRALDLHDPVPTAYTLEVSSPGLDRPLRTEADYARFAGRKIDLTAREPIEGQRRWKGRLVGIDGGCAAVEVDGRTVRVPLEQVASARLVVDMSDLRQDFSRRGRMGV